MASIINASSTGSGGIVQTADASGVLQLQSNGNVVVTVNASLNVGIGSTTPSTVLHVEGANAVLASPGLLTVQATTSGADIGGQITFQNNTARRAAIAGRQESTDAIAGYLQFGTRGTVGDITERMRISSAGYVTQPYQPAFMAYSVNSAATFTAGTTIVFDGASFNIGSNYSTTTGRFTAPIAGVYHFCRNQQSYSGSNQEVFFYKNGSQVNDTTSVFSVGSNGNNSSIYLSLAASDYVTVYQYSGTSNGDYNNFSGRLVG